MPSSELGSGVTQVTPFLRVRPVQRGRISTHCDGTSSLVGWNASRTRQTPMTKPRFIPAILVLGAISLNAQGPTLREIARSGGGVVGGIGCGWAGAPFRGIAGRADLVIEGTLMTHRSYPTPDERQIFTDYEFSVIQVIFQRKPQSSNCPGPPMPFIFKTQVFDGLNEGMTPIMPVGMFAAKVREVASQ
jgi:hypothetical protein